VTETRAGRDRRDIDSGLLCGARFTRVGLEQGVVGDAGLTGARSLGVDMSDTMPEAARPGGLGMGLARCDGMTVDGINVTGPALRP